MLYKYIYKFIVLFLFFFSGFNVALAQNEADAIAVRVIPNPEGYSAMRWYQERGFSGSPQAMVVDGYEAVRDGRTVYVGAANISDANLYTNIYLISFNQQAGTETQDIFGQILKHWKFNTNLSTDGACNLTTDMNCVVNEDCPEEEYCISEKLGVVRDVRRLADLGEVRTAISRYYSRNGKYPKMDSGTYLSHVSMSVWPSWQKVLATELETFLNVDPVNKLGDCAPEFHPVTCWNNDSRTFGGGYIVPGDDSIAPQISFPVNSLVYLYTAASNGSAYRLCAEMESGYIAGCSGGVVDTGTAQNHPPRLIGSNFPPALPGGEYHGFVEVLDPDGDELTWTPGSTGGWTNASWNPTQNPGQYEFYAPQAGGTATVGLSVTDGRSAPLTLSFNINSSNNPPRISVNNMTFPADPDAPFSFQIAIEDTNLSSSPSAHFESLTRLGCPPSFNESTCLSDNVCESLTCNDSVSGFRLESGSCDTSIGRCTYDFSGSMGAMSGYDSPGDLTSWSFEVVFDDNAGAQARKTFSVSFSGGAPIIELSGINPIPVGIPITSPGMEIARVRPGGDSAIYAVYIDPSSFGGALTLPGLSIITEPSSPAGTELLVRLTGTPTQIIPTYKDYLITLYAADIAGALSSRQFEVRVFNNPPQIAFTAACPGVGRVYQAIPDGCRAVASDSADGHIILDNTYSFPGVYPEGVSIENNPLVNIPGTISGAPAKAGSYDIAVAVRDVYGAVGEGRLHMNVSSFCGDGIVDRPNSERRGGPLGDGYEQCDGAESIAATPAESGPNRHYWCSTMPLLVPGSGCPPGDTSPDCAATCEFRDGYCGDNWVQNNAMGNITNHEQCDFGEKETTLENPGPGQEYRCVNCVWEGGNCGNNEIDIEYEDCDPPGPGNGTSANDQYLCDDTCRWSGGFCGNGTIESVEECDDGNSNNADCCASNCEWSCPGPGGSNYQTTQLVFPADPFTGSGGAAEDPANFNIGKTNVHVFDGAGEYGFGWIMNFPPCRPVESSALGNINGYLPYEGFFDFEVSPAREVTAIVFIIDRSGSMDTGPMESAKAAASATITGLRNIMNQWFLDTIYVGLVDYSSSVSSHDIGLLTPEHRNNLIAEIETYTAGGSTNTDDALQEAYDMLEDFANDHSDVQNRAIILLTDGEPDGGPADTQAVADAVKDDIFNDQPIELYTIAYGNLSDDSYVSSSGRTAAELRADMCDWSSADGACASNGQDNNGAGEYAWVSPPTDIEAVLRAISFNIIDLPRGDVSIGIGPLTGWAGWAEEEFTVNTIVGPQPGSFLVSSENCTAEWQWMGVIVNVGGSTGKILIRNPRLNYCQSCY